MEKWNEMGPSDSNQIKIKIKLKIKSETRLKVKTHFKRPLQAIFEVFYFRISVVNVIFSFSTMNSLLQERLRLIDLLSVLHVRDVCLFFTQWCSKYRNLKCWWKWNAEMHPNMRQAYDQGLAPKSCFLFLVFIFKIELWIVLKFKRWEYHETKQNRSTRMTRYGFGPVALPRISRNRL